jgi:alginate O-acetyltransferase complex protein AlgI
MLFNSIQFIAGFFPVVVAGYFLVGRYSRRLAALWLAAASLFFYGWWNTAYVGLLLTSVVFNYCLGYLIARQRMLNHTTACRLLLAAAVAANLSLLGYYKYAGFFAAALLQFSGLNLAVGQIVLPLGISFFTFTQIAFLVDAHRGKAKEYDFVHYLLFVTYFPHLIAGPILHHAQMMPQFAQRITYKLDWSNIGTGLTFFVLGLSKKVLLADMFSNNASQIFQAVDHGATPMLAEAWVAALTYTLQLYFDFSGYSDMAIGLSLFFNIRLPLNFNSPYKAINIIDFWRRWHMTLSAFLRDYLYIPLGGNRHGPARRYLNLLVTMLLGGLWHGAGWTFVIWGGLHGVYLMVNHAFHALRRGIGWREGALGRAGTLVSTGFTFAAVVVAWVFFRASNFGTAAAIVKGMFGLNGVSLFTSTSHLPPAVVDWLLKHGVVFYGFTPITYFTGHTMTQLLVGLSIIWLLPNSQEWVGISDAGAPKSWALRWLGTWRPRNALTAVGIGVLLGICLIYVMAGAPSEFLYFQF